MRRSPRPMESMQSSRPTKAQAFALLAPIVLALVGYSRSLRGEFQLDDYVGIHENGAIKAFWPWLQGLSLPGDLVAGRPLTQLTFALNYAAGRLEPLGYHAVNLAIHLAVVLLVGLLTLRVAALAGAGRPRRIAVGVAGLFAVHPLQSQAVSYVSQRSEILASAFYVATLLLLLARDPGVRPRPWGYWAAAVGTLVLGFAAKPIVVTVPAAFLAIRLAASPPSAAEGGRRWRDAWPALAPVVAVAMLLSGALLLALRGKPDAGFAVAGTTPWLYLLTQLRALLVYLRLLAWPWGQTIDWDFPTSPGLADPATLGAALAVLSVAAAAVALFVRGRRHATPAGAAARLAGLGIAWFFILLAPTSSVVPLADNLVEHRVYLASWGILLAAVVAAEAAAARLGSPRGAVIGWLVVVAVLSVALWSRNAAWETRLALWSDAVEKSPESAGAHLSFAEALTDAGRFPEAIREYELALSYTGGNLARRAKVLLSLGMLQMSTGRLEEAGRSFAEGLHFYPSHPDLLVAMASVEGASGDMVKAESLARRALAVDGRNARAWYLLGNLAMERGDWSGALAAYDRAAALDRDRAEAHFGRATALRELGRGVEECAALGDAIRARLGGEYLAAAQSRVAAGCR